jgi:ADP-ribose pyrophosphatase
MKNLEKWKLIESEMVIDHHWSKVRRDKIELPNGKIIDDYFVNIRLDVALILPITKNQEIIFVRQYRHGIGEFFMELPAGSFDPLTEDSQEAALRELQEETGYTTSDIKKIATVYDKPSKDTNQIHLFLAENAIKVSEQNLDETEEIEVILIPINQVVQKIAEGEISVAGSVAAIFMGLNFLKNAKN